ncbi:MAG TPA: hypothetical protein DGR97_01170 [Gammaproteobacteria bacterium]|nr:hypothetical protein [Gammaproteobacteria bacterium]
MNIGHQWYTHERTKKAITAIALLFFPAYTADRLANTALREVHKGPANVRFSTSPADEVAEIAVRKVIGGFYYHTDFTLGGGRILHNYISNG